MNKCLLPGRARGYREDGNKALDKVETKDGVVGVDVAYDGNYWNPGNRPLKRRCEGTAREEGRERG